MKAFNTGGSGDDLPKCPEGLHQAVCVDVIDNGFSDVVYQGNPVMVERNGKKVQKKKREVTFVFQVDARTDDDEPIRRDDGKMFLVYAKFTASLADTAKLLPFLETWLGKPIPQNIRDSGFDMDKLIGRNAQIQVVHNTSQKNGKTYANVKGILPITAKTTKLTVEDGYVREQDRPDYDPPFGSEAWQTVHGELDGIGQPVVSAQDTAGEESQVPPDDDGEQDDLPF